MRLQVVLDGRTVYQVICLKVLLAIVINRLHWPVNDLVGLHFAVYGWLLHYFPKLLKHLIIPGEYRIISAMLASHHLDQLVLDLVVVGLRVEGVFVDLGHEWGEHGGVGAAAEVFGRALQLESLDLVLMCKIWDIW